MGKCTTEAKWPPCPITLGVHGITGDMNLDHQVKVTFARAPHCEGKGLTFKCLMCTEHDHGR